VRLRDAIEVVIVEEMSLLSCLLDGLGHSEKPSGQFLGLTVMSH
jgi:hypothetical protein